MSIWRALCVLLAICAPAAGTAATPVKLARTEQWSQHSVATGQQYSIAVSLPKAVATEPQRERPLIVVLDADYAFALARNMVEHLSDRGRMPPAIVVGVGYPEGIESIDTYRRHRTRDYTPTHSVEGGYGPEIMRRSGGGPKFYQFLRTELLPELDKRFPIDAESRTLVGHSFGGLFAAYALGQQDVPFQNFIIVSPSLWFDDRTLLKSFVDRKSASGAPDRRVFLAVGGMEAGMMSTDLGALHRSLCRQQGQNTWLRIFPDEHHDSVFPVALSHGLRLIANERMLPSAVHCVP